ncbi:MAG TPA: hypothetical protein VGD65_10380 [Chryseosolibacter sp.]
MAILLSYDVKRTNEKVHTDLKNRLTTSYGFQTQIVSDDNKRYDLPNTTLRKEGVSPQQGAKDFLTACKDVGAQWERYIVCEYTHATFNNQS